jgi:redox-sensitive bicupin YhaK (pirin superfamily)
VEPRYQQITLDVAKQKNDFTQILSPNVDDEGVWIYQDAWFYLSDFDKDFSKKLSLKKEGNGFYVMNIEGEIEVNGEKLEKRDAIGIWETSEIEIKANASSKFLVMEIPMEQ